MNNYLSELTVIIVTYKTNFEILKKCLHSIDPKIKTIIIENSKFFLNQQEVQKNFPNVEILCTGFNLGMGAGNNFGLSKVKTRYALTLNPDVICEKDYFENINIYLDKKVDFKIIGSQYDEKSDYKSAFFFDNKVFDYNMEADVNFLQKVDWVVGCTLLFDLYKFNSRKIFDEKYFLYYEETDLCLRLKKEGQQVYSSKKLKINHLGAKGSVDENSSTMEFIKIRNWHLMWSSFYYYKKNNSYMYGIVKSFGTLTRSIFKTFFYLIFFNKKQFTKYLYRSFGLICSIIGTSSWYRLD